jgi:hypothetical protein
MDGRPFLDAIGKKDKWKVGCFVGFFVSLHKILSGKVLESGIFNAP